MLVFQLTYNVTRTARLDCPIQKKPPPSCVYALETTKLDISLDTRLIINLTLSLLVSAPENQSLLNVSGGDRLCLSYVATLGALIDIR